MGLLPIKLMRTPLWFSEVTSLLDLLLKGGWVMWPLLLLSILTLYAMIERWIVLQRYANIPTAWLEAITAKLSAGDIQSVKTLCIQRRNVVARIIAKGLALGQQPTEIIERALERTGQMEIYRLERNLSLLGTIAGIAPMLGFLGTVLGMIQAFMAMAQTSHHISPQLLSGGIYEAMITTATGLIIGISAQLGYNYLSTQIQKATHRIEQAANQLLENIAHPNH